MTIGVESLLSPNLNAGARYEEIVAVLGAPQETGRGLRGFTILSYREKTVQCTMHAGRLFLLAFYFRPTVDLPNWPECLAALACFSDTMKPREVEDWLHQQGVQFRRSSVCGVEVLEAPIGVRFCFESGLLSSIQVISEAPVPDSPTQPEMYLNEVPEIGASEKSRKKL